MQMPTFDTHGLDTATATQRLKSDGPNEVPEKPFSFSQAVLKRLWEPSAWILEAALLLEIFLGKTIQAGFILIMLLFAAIDGAIQSRRATTVLTSLAHKLTPTAAVKRDGRWQQVPAKDLVVGDLISLNRGDLIPADAQLLTDPLDINESSISGESAAVTHQPDQTIYAGTEVLSGHALARITATGTKSRAGKTVSLVNQSAAPGHLQVLLGKIIGYLAILDTVLAVILIAVAIWRGENLIDMLPFLAMLFIATIPIAMPSSFAVANSVEAKQLSKQHVLVSDLGGIQEAANLDLFLVDKTGTITANRPTVVSFTNLSTIADETVIRLATAATDSRNASVIDQAIQAYLNDQHLTAFSQEQFVPFDPATGYSNATVTWQDAPTTVRLGGYTRLVKLAKTAPQTNVDFSAGRTVAVMVNDTVAGVFVLQDQPRADSAAAIQTITSRGVKVIMLTGDNVQTAQAVAQQVGLTGDVVAFDHLNQVDDLHALAGIADVVPENKLAVVQRFQKLGNVVGMTGDGVNDAPALKQAEVGVAVANATDLAKRSAKMVLLTEGLTPLADILDSGHRVYQRMMTWTITKLSRTAELTMLLTFGYLALRFIPLELNAMILVAILNDVVTLVLGTDHTITTKRPENWNLRRLSQLAGVLAVTWTVVGLGLMAWLHGQGVTAGQLSTALYWYLITSAMLTILMTRTPGLYWRSAPSSAVVTAITGNLVLTLILALAGWGVTAISWQLLGGVLLLVLALSVLLDLLYVALQRHLFTA